FKNFGAFFAQYQSIMKSLSLGMNLSVMCPEDAAFIRRGEIERETRGTFLGDRLVRSVMRVCQEWPRGALAKNYHGPVRSDVPALIFSGALDPDAPPSRGMEVARHLANSLHAVMEGMSHTSFPACAQSLAAQFISSGTVKGLDTSCLKELRRPAFAVPQR
ncbi:MAG: alpha/beta hydrolase, partial [Acidobacteriota bacterium]